MGQTARCIELYCVVPHRIYVLCNLKNTVCNLPNQSSCRWFRTSDTSKMVKPLSATCHVIFKIKEIISSQGPRYLER
jgi:hypothetical protein